MARAGAESPLLARIGDGEIQPLYLVSGEPVLSEAAGRRIAEALVQGSGAEVEVSRRPETLAPILSDLRTYSLFGAAKVRLVLESAVLSDRQAGAYLIDQAAEALPVAPEESLTESGRRAASRLLQVCRLFGLDADTGAAETLLDQLPDSVFAGGAPPRSRVRPKRRSKAAAEDLKSQLVDLLQAARREGLRGWAEGDAADLAIVVEEGLPEGHALVLCEAAVADEHPLVQSLRQREALIELDRIESDRRGQWQGVEALARELAVETGRGISRPARDELARRTLRRSSERGAGGATDPSSTARFAAEYRKLAALTDDGDIELETVRTAVEDRGEEDLWALLDAIGEGRRAQALGRLRRLLAGSEDETAARLAFFAQLAQFCRQLTAVSGMMEVAGVPVGERSYQRFKARHAAALQAALEKGTEPLLGKLHPFRLFRAYSAAGRFPRTQLATLPSRVLETELRLKGESADADAALVELVIWLTSPGSGA